MATTRTIATFKDDLSRKLHGTDLSQLSKVTDVNSVIREAAGNVLAEIDPSETIRSSQITNAIHDRVYDYPLPSDLKGNKIVDLQRQVRRTNSDSFNSLLTKEFDLYKELSNNMLQIVNQDGIKSIRIRKVLTGRVVVDSVDSITGNGNWAVGDDATNLTVDSVNFVSGSASLNFDLDGSTTAGHLENSTLNSVDLTTHDEQSSWFVWLFIPDPSAMTSVDLRWGNDTSNYWNRTVTAASDATAFRTGWNLLRFDWNGATETGTVDPATIDYLRVTVNYDGTADTDFRLDTIVSSLGTIFDIVYYSKFLFQTSAGVYIEGPTADTDTINLDTSSYNILLYETARMLAQELQGEDSVFDANYFAGELYGTATKQGLIPRYKRSNPPETLKPKSTYYRVRTFNRKNGTNFII